MPKTMKMRRPSVTPGMNMTREIVAEPEERSSLAVFEFAVEER